MKILSFAIQVGIAFSLVSSIQALGENLNISEATYTRAQENAGAIKIGRKSSQARLQLAITLQLKDPVGLSKFLQRVYDPSDPLFHQFLTPAQFADQFGPSNDDFEKVAQYLNAQGLQVVSRHPNRLVLDVSGSVSTIESLFQIQLNDYIATDLHDVHNEGHIVYKPDSDPVVPSAIAQQVHAIVGLNSFHRLKKYSHKSNQSISPHEVSGKFSVSSYMTPAKIKSVYNISATGMTGAGETMALFELDGYTASDISEYASYFSFSPPTLENIYVNGATGTPSSGADSGADEVTLDIEMAMAMAPGLTKLMIYEGPPQSADMSQAASDAELIDVYSKIASDNLAKTVSTSWGSAENENDSNLLNSESNILQEMASQGQSFFAAAGDSGAYDDSINDLNSTLEVDDPGSQLYSTSVGGTTLYWTSGGAYSSETSWITALASGAFNTPNYSPDEGGGGGISRVWSIPTWQSGLATTANKGSNTMRMVPDVSLDADPNSGYPIYYGGSWNLYGGTSCAAPLWAAFTSLVNQKRVASGTARIGFINPTLYQVAGSSAHASDFHDIADGSTNLYYPAEAGFDLTTGWGSFNGANLFTSLVAIEAAVPSAPTGLVVEVIQ